MNLKMNDLLTKDMITIEKKQIDDWKTAIRIAAKPMVKTNIITKQYVEKMISNVIEFGPYINLTTNFAMPHATGADGANRVGMSLLLLKYPVFLLNNQDRPIKIFLCLGCKDAITHLEALSHLADFLSEPKNIEDLAGCKTKDEVLEIIRKEENK